MASKKKSAGAGKTLNKSEFVRSLPADLPGKDVVEKAKEQGIKLSLAYVYSIRTAAKASTRKGTGDSASAPSAPPPVARRGPVPRAAAVSTTINGSRIEDLLRAVAAELGLSHAIGLLQAEQAKVRAVLGG